MGELIVNLLMLCAVIFGIYKVVEFFTVTLGFLFWYAAPLVAFILIVDGNPIGFIMLASLVVLAIVKSGMPTKETKKEKTENALVDHPTQATENDTSGFAVKVMIPASKVTNVTTLIGTVFDNLKWDNIISRSANHIEAKIVTRSSVWEGETVLIESQQLTPETIEVAVHSRSNTGLEDGINARNVLLAVDQIQQLSR